MCSPVSLRILKLCFVFTAACLATTPAEATDLSLRLLGQATTSDADALGLGEDLGTSPGAYVGVEWRLGERLGLELGVAWTELEQSARQDVIIFSAETTASLTLMPVTVALDVHLTPKARYDLYLAPRVGWAFFDDLEVRNEIDLSGFPGFPGFPGLPTLPTFPGLSDVTTIRLPVEDQFVYGLRVGFDVPFGEGSWSFASSLDVLAVDLELEAAGGFTVALDPVSIGLGFARRF